MKGKFLRGQAVTEASNLPIWYKIEKDYTAASTGIGAEDKYAKSAVTPVIFKSSDKVILLLAYWEVVLTPMKSVVDKYKLD